MPYKDSNKKREYARTLYANSPTYALNKRNARVLRVYNVSYPELFEQQKGLCAICGRPGLKLRLAVDHDHLCCPGKTSCGKCVRGLLCGTCNRMVLPIIEAVGTAKIVEYITSRRTHDIPS